MDLVTAGGVQVARTLYDFVNAEAIPGTGVAQAAFWRGLGALIRDLAPRNRALLDRRDTLQRQIDAWHLEQRGKPIDAAAYTEFLRGICYLQPEPPAFSIATRNVDPEIAAIAGPQLVVPVTNARYALNAANARWGSLYDALYGTDAIPEDAGAMRGPGYNPVRGDRVIAKARQVLDQAAPLAVGSHRDATRYAIDEGRLAITLKDRPGPGSRGRSSSPDIAAAPTIRRPCCCGTTVCTSRSSSIPRVRSDNRMRRGLPTWCWRPRSPRSRIARIRWPASMLRTR